MKSEVPTGGGVAATEVTDQVVTNGTSVMAPSLTGDGVFGTLVTWRGEDGTIHIASDQESPPYAGEVLPAGWTTSDSPAVCLALQWARVYLAFTESNGVYIASTGGGDGWKHFFVADGALGGPAMAFDGASRLFVAWRDQNSKLSLAVCDEKDNITCFPTELTIYSNPSLTWANGKGLYALSGSDVDADGDAVMRCFLSGDGGGSFSPVPLPDHDAIGAPSLVVSGAWYYLTWADIQLSQLNFAATQDLQSFTGTRLPVGCHGGAPAMISCGDHLTAAWTYGAQPEDPRAHHVTLGDLPLSAQKSIRDTQGDSEGYSRLLKVGAVDPCPDPGMVWDPSDETCVSKFGPVGTCVLSSFNGAYGGQRCCSTPSSSLSALPGPLSVGCLK